MGITHPGKEALSRELKALEQKAGVVPRSHTKGRAAVIRRVEKRSGTELLNTTVSDWVLSGAPAHEFEHLWAYVEVLNESAYGNRPPEAAEADRKAWRALWSRAREATAGGDGSPQGQTVLEARELPGWPVRDVRDPFALEVQRAIEALGDNEASPLPVLPVYVEREHDALLRASVLGAQQGRSALVTLIGGSSNGKTRACWEAVQLLPTTGGCGTRSSRTTPMRPSHACSRSGPAPCSGSTRSTTICSRVTRPSASGSLRSWAAADEEGSDWQTAGPSWTSTHGWPTPGLSPSPSPQGRTPSTSAESHRRSPT